MTAAATRPQPYYNQPSLINSMDQTAYSHCSCRTSYLAGDYDRRSKLAPSAFSVQVQSRDQPWIDDHAKKASCDVVDQAFRCHAFDRAILTALLPFSLHCALMRVILRAPIGPSRFYAYRSRRLSLARKKPRRKPSNLHVTC